MKSLLLALAAILLPAFPLQLLAQAKGDAKTELIQLVEQVKKKIQAGKKSEADLADEMKQFDALLAEHKGEKTDDVAKILFMKASLYMEVLDDTPKATELFKQLKTDYPDTEAGKHMDQVLAQVEKMAESKKIQKAMAPGAAFPDFDEKDLDGKPLSIANYKGHVVLIDFWATWCGPCVAELPNVIKAYEKYHAKGFEIISISLDKDKEKLTSYIKEHNMTWQQYFDGQGWQNKLAVKYGINSIPATYLLGKDGKIIDKGLRGEALDMALAKALGQ